MRQPLLAVVLLGAIFSTSVNATPQCKSETIELLATAVAESYEAMILTRFDAGKLHLGTMRIVIEHSLADDDAKDRFLVRRFKSFANFEAWLKSREIEGLPARESRPLERCAKGVCTYKFDGGILHNHLYLKKITYGFRGRGRCPYIKTIYLLDGD